MESRTIDGFVVCADKRGDEIVFTAWVRAITSKEFCSFRHIDDNLFARVDKQALPPELYFDTFQASLRAVALRIIFDAFPELQDYVVDKMYGEVRCLDTAWRGQARLVKAATKPKITKTKLLSLAGSVV